MPTPEIRPRAATLVVTGIAGSGKTTVGRTLALRLEWEFHDADDLHAPEAVARMRTGRALNDEWRAPWLARVRRVMEDVERRDVGAVIACSALKAGYRRMLAEGLDRVTFVFLQVPPDVALTRLGERSGHFAGPSLLASQLEALEPPTDALTLDATRSVEELVQMACDYLVRSEEGGAGR